MEVRPNDQDIPDEGGTNSLRHWNRWSVPAVDLVWNWGAIWWADNLVLSPARSQSAPWLGSTRCFRPLCLRQPRWFGQHHGARPTYPRENLIFSTIDILEAPTSFNLTRRSWRSIDFAVHLFQLYASPYPPNGGSDPRLGSLGFMAFFFLIYLLQPRLLWGYRANKNKLMMNAGRVLNIPSRKL